MTRWSSSRASRAPGAMNERHPSLLSSRKPNSMANALSMKCCPGRAPSPAATSVCAPALLALTLLAPAAVCAQASERASLSFSGFGTLGYAMSDRAYRYQRFIDERGGFQRDTVLGGQVDWQLAAQWSATYQAMAAPSVGNDEDWSLRTTWAFLSWRPNNDWLLRAGKQRVPLFLNAEK